MKVWDKILMTSIKPGTVCIVRYWWNEADMVWVFFWSHWYDLFGNRKLQIKKYKSQVANYKSQITNFKLQTTNYKLTCMRDHIFETSWHVSKRMCVRGSDWAGQLGLRQLWLGLGMQGFVSQERHEQLHPKCSSTWQNCPKVSFLGLLTHVMRNFPWGCVRTLGVVGAWEFVEQQAAGDRLSGFQVPRCFLGAAQVLSSRSGEQPSSRLPGYQPGPPPRSFIGILDTKVSKSQLIDWVYWLLTPLISQLQESCSTKKNLNNGKCFAIILDEVTQGQHRGGDAGVLGGVGGPGQLRGHQPWGRGRRSHREAIRGSPRDRGEPRRLLV